MEGGGVPKRAPPPELLRLWNIRRGLSGKRKHPVVLIFEEVDTTTSPHKALDLCDSCSVCGVRVYWPRGRSIEWPARSRCQPWRHCTAPPHCHANEASVCNGSNVPFVVTYALHCKSPKGAITSKIKHAIKLKTRPTRLAQLLQSSLAFCFSLQPMTAYRPVVQQLCKSCRTCFIFYCMFYFTCDRSLNRRAYRNCRGDAIAPLVQIALGWPRINRFMTTRARPTPNQSARPITNLIRRGGPLTTGTLQLKCGG